MDTELMDSQSEASKLILTFRETLDALRAVDDQSDEDLVSLRPNLASRR